METWAGSPRAVVPLCAAQTTAGWKIQEPDEQLCEVFQAKTGHS